MVHTYTQSRISVDLFEEYVIFTKRRRAFRRYEGCCVRVTLHVLEDVRFGQCLPRQMIR